MQKINNLLLIAGTGRNTGKTSLACSIINNFHHQHRLIGIKISPHFHPENKKNKAICSSDSWFIYEEMKADTEKDSSKMLDAGAMRVFYIEVEDADLAKAFENLLMLIPEHSLLVCESPALRKYIHPSVFFIVDHPRQKNKKRDVLELIPSSDYSINTREMHVNQLVPALSIENGGWRFDSRKIIAR